MRRKRCTDKNAHNIHITMPNRVIPTATIANPSIGSIDIMAGSFCRMKYSPDASNMFAMMPEKNPIHMFLIMKGRLIKPHVAPTSFMVCSRNRLEYIDNLTRLPMSDHEISVSITNSAINNNPARCMLLFIVSTRSFW